jgi:hypothetical protein
MVAFSVVVVSFSSLYHWSDIFSAMVSRVEEMTLAILRVTAVHCVQSK